MTKLCTVPDCNNAVAPTSKYMCEEHLRKERAIARPIGKANRDAHRENGQCIKCVKPAFPGMVYCAGCMAKKNEVLQYRRAVRELAGQCRYCGSEA